MPKSLINKLIIYRGKIHPAILLSTGTHRRDDSSEERQNRSSLLCSSSRYYYIITNGFFFFFQFHKKQQHPTHAWATTSHHKPHTHTGAILCGSSINGREHDDEVSKRETKHVDVSLDDNEDDDTNESNNAPVLTERRIFAAVVVPSRRPPSPPPPHSTSPSEELTAEPQGHRRFSSTLNAPTSILPGVDGTGTETETAETHPPPPPSLFLLVIHPSPS